MVKKLFGLFCGMILMICASAFTSCDKQEEIFEAPQVTNPITEVKEPQMTELRATGNWIESLDSYKENYYSAYRNASNRRNGNVEKYPMTVGFFSIVNAVFSTSFHQEENFKLNELCDYNPNYGWFGIDGTRGYTDEATFQSQIYRFIEKYNRPVAIYATTQPWTKKQITDNILIVWDVSKSHVKVTKISEPPSKKFNNNNIIQLTWNDLFSKAIDASSVTPKVANVAYPVDSNPHGL